jgi:hypothetical protein
MCLRRAPEKYISGAALDRAALGVYMESEALPLTTKDTLDQIRCLKLHSITSTKALNFILTTEKTSINQFSFHCQRLSFMIIGIPPPSLSQYLTTKMLYAATPLCALHALFILVSLT